MPETDLFGRVAGLFGKAGVLGISIVLLALIVLCVLALLNKRTALLAVCLIALVFSGAAPTTGMGEGATVLRWVVMGLMALTTFWGVRSPGLALWLIGGMAAYGIILSPASPVWLWAAEVSGLLFVVAIPFAAAIADHIRSVDDIFKLLKMYLLAAGLLAILGVISLPELVRGGGAIGERFAGSVNSAVYVLQGGLMLPICLWGAMQPRLRRWRTYCFVVGASLLMLCLLSGTRTGTFAGILGCFPLLSRLGWRKVFTGVGVFIVAMVVLFWVLSLIPERGEQLYERYVGGLGTGDYTTGRVERWTAALQLCLREPFFGHGVGSEYLLGFGMHNAYLKAWWELGITGLLLFVLAFAIMLGKSVLLMVRRFDTEVSDLGRLFTGMLIVLVSAGFFEGKLLSPSNVSIVTTVLVGVMLSRMSVLLRADARVASDLDESPGRGSSYPVGEWSAHQA